MVDEGFEERTGRTARRHADELDPMVTARLARARREAVGLVSAQHRRPRRPRSRFAVATALIVVLGALGWYLTTRPMPEAPASEDLEIVMGEAPLGLYEELDFHIWLEEQGALEEVDDADTD